MANVNIQLGYKDSAWFTANATLVLLAGQIVYLQQTGTYKIGDGVTQLQNLAFKGVSAQTDLVVATVVNNTGVNLLASNYQAVKVSTAQGQRLAVDFAQANNDNNSADTIGIIRQNINNNQEGEVVILGTISEVNTTGSLQGETWADGDILYLSPTVAGRITKVKPNGLTGHMVVIGYVEYAHSQHGKIYVKIQNGYELEELHNTADVSYSTPIDADSLLIKDSTASLWKRLTWANFKTALSSLFVGKTGNETIAGRKTFNPNITAVSSIAQGTIMSPTLIASANSDVLVGLDIAPTFTNGAFTNVNNIGIRTTTPILIGNATSIPTVSIGKIQLYIKGLDGGTVGRTTFLVENTNNSSGANFVLKNSSGKNMGAQITSSGYITGESANFFTQGGISLLINVDGDVISGGTSVIKFQTGGYATSPTMTITAGNPGNVLIGTTTDAGYRLDINGTARIQDVLTVGRLATEPTTNLQNGQIYYNTTTNKFRAYENGAWANLI